MLLVPQMPQKVQYLLKFSFPLVTKLCGKSAAEKFVGGRKGYDKEMLFGWLLVKKKHVYEKVMTSMVKDAYRQKLIKGKYVAIDSSFVHTFSQKGEMGSEGWNEFKEAFGFKLHLLIDCETKFPIVLIITNGIAADSTLAIPLLKKARYWLKRSGYVLADKGYDWQDLVNWIVKKLGRKAGIPIKKYKRGKNYTWEGAWRNFQLKRKGRSIKKSIYNRRTAVERVFAVLKRTYHLGKEETRGIVNFAKNVYLTLICYMLKLFDIAKTS